MMAMIHKCQSFMALARLDKPVGSILLLWPTAWALLLSAEGIPTIKLMIIFALGVVLMRSAGCVMNDIADRDFDPLVSRTRLRPLASGQLQLYEAVAFLFGLLSLALLVLLQLDWQTILLGFVAAVLAAIYPFMKRFTHLPQVFLALAFNWGVIMAFSATCHTIPPEAWLLYCIGCCWTIGYDSIYALVDREDDVRCGIKSSAVLLGESTQIFVATLYCFMLIGLILLGQRLGFSWYYSLGILLVAMHLIWQVRAMRGDEPEVLFAIFKSNQTLGFLVLLTMIVGLFV